MLQRAEMRDVPDDTANVVRRVQSLLRRSNWQPQDFAAFQRSRPKQDEFLREFSPERIISLYQEIIERTVGRSEISSPVQRKKEEAALT